MTKGPIEGQNFGWKASWDLNPGWWN